MKTVVQGLPRSYTEADRKHEHNHSQVRTQTETPKIRRDATKPKSQPYKIG